MNDEKLAERMSEARLIAASDNVLFPLIKSKIEQRMTLAASKFEAGERDFVGDIAYIAGLKEIERELKQKITDGNKAIKILAERQDKN